MEIKYNLSASFRHVAQNVSVVSDDESVLYTVAHHYIYTIYNISNFIQFIAYQVYFSIVEVYQTNKPSEGEHLFMETTETAIIMLETERLVKLLSCDLSLAY